MTWVKKDFPTIEGYESLGDTVQAKRFLDFKIHQLLDTGDPLWEYKDELKTRKSVCDFVISKIDYPMARGVPTDLHKNNWFSGLCCHKITQDYWQSASETLRTLRLNRDKGYGDCEDVSVLFTTLFLMKKWRAWECIGYVLQNEQVLGGHGWALFQDNNRIWRLYEATLSEPPDYPDGYPEVDSNNTEWKVDDLTYKALIKFDRKEYWESSEGGLVDTRLRARLKDKETRKKHEAISTAWKQKTKPLRKLSLLGRMRWRK